MSHPRHNVLEERKKEPKSILINRILESKGIVKAKVKIKQRFWSDVLIYLHSRRLSTNCIARLEMN